MTGRVGACGRTMGAVALWLSGLLPADARAADRFLRAYPTDGPAPAEVVASVDSAVGVGRDGFHLGFDERLALGVGLGERLTTRVALELLASTDEGENEALTTETAWRGVRWEWQLGIVERERAPIGLAAWLAPGVAPASADAEIGLLFDAGGGRTRVAAHGIVAPTVTFARANVLSFATGVEAAASGAVSLGAVDVGAGIYGRSVIAGRAAEYVALFAGPTVAWHVPGVWRGALTVAPQLPAPVRATADRAVVITEYDRLSVLLEISATL